MGSIRSSGAYRMRVVATNGTMTRTGVWRDFEVALVATTPAVITSATSITGKADLWKLPGNRRGQPRYVGTDRDQHSGGVAKELDRQGRRIGTCDADIDSSGNLNGLKWIMD